MRSECAALLRGLILVAACACAIPSCARTVADGSLVQREELRADELEFLSQLESVPVVTNDDALHALFLFERGEDPFETYEQRVEEARRLGWLPLRDAAPPAQESARIGTVSVAIARITRLKGGLTMRIVGPTPRAATRELVFLGVLPDRTEHQALTGPEFIEVLGRAERLLVGEPLHEVDETFRRLERERAGDDLPENVRDVQQERQRDARPQ